MPYRQSRNIGTGQYCRRSIAIKEGCHREKQCSPNPCQNDGMCVDDWDAFICDCIRPFLPPHCIQKLPEVTLGHDNISSRIEFTTNGDANLVKFDTDISLLMRTNKRDGALLYIGEKEVSASLFRFLFCFQCVFIQTQNIWHASCCFHFQRH